MLLLGESLTGAGIAGAVLVLAGTLLVTARP
jgi:drug/metabolite transporter (DMT)-like permease